MLYLLVLPMTFLGSLGAFFFKLSAANAVNLASLLKNWRLYLGGTLYVGSALCNILLLRFLDFSILYPMTAVTYIWTLFLSNRLLEEEITKRKLIGVAMLCIGILILTQ